MRRCLLLIATLVQIVLSTALGQPGVESEPSLPLTTVRVIIHELKNETGRVLLALYESAKGFPDDPKDALETINSTIEADTVTFTLEKVEPGRYAISVLHDENDNGKMETGLFGRPKEGYGFSNDARGFMGPPAFSDAAFEVADEPITLHVKMKY